MGGRDRQKPKLADRENWITEVSDSRLNKYIRMLSSSVAPVRLDGSTRIIGGKYFRDLVEREKDRRK